MENQQPTIEELLANMVSKRVKSRKEQRRRGNLL
jgi:hypothetical protein